MLSSHGDRDVPKALGDVEHGGGSGGAVHSSSAISSGSVAPAPAPAPPESEPAPMRNLYTAALSYNGFTITDGALRLIVLLHAADLGFNAIEIAFMFSMYEVAGVFTNLFGGVAGSRYGLRCTLLASLVLQIACLAALTQTEPILGDLAEAKSGSTRYLEATIYITAWQALAGVAKDLMKLTGKSTPKLVTKDGAEGRLFQLVAWLTGMKNALKGFGHFLGALLVARIGYVGSLWILVGICAVFLPVGAFGMDRRLGISSSKKMEWGRLFRKGRDVNVLSAARFFLFGSRDVWFEIGLPLFLRVELGWERELVGLILAGYIVIYGNLQAASTKLYKKSDGTSGRPTSASAYKWAAYCSLAPLLTGIATYCTHTVAENNLATAFVLILGLTAFAAMFAVNSSVHSYLIVSYSNKDKVAMDLGFYYMANAMGRLVGTLLGGFLYFYTSDDFGLSICLLVACPFLVAAAAIAYRLPDPVTPSPPPPPPAPQLPAARSLDDEREEAKKPEAAAAAAAVPGARAEAEEDTRSAPESSAKGGATVADVADEAEAKKSAIGDVFKSFEVVGEVSAAAAAAAAGAQQTKDDAPNGADFACLEGVVVAAAAPGAAAAEKNTERVFDSLEGFPATEAELLPRPPPPPQSQSQSQPQPPSGSVARISCFGGARDETPEMPTE